MLQLKQVTLTFVVAHRKVLAISAKAAAEGVFEHSWSYTREVLVNRVTRNVCHFERVLFLFLVHHAESLGP